MTADELLARIGDGIGVRRVFGEPIDRDGTTLVPVAMVAGGGGAGSGPDGGPDGTGGEGAGYGVWARGIGAYTIRQGEVRFVPAVDVALLAGLAAAVVGRVLIRALGSRRHDRTRPAR
jgi:uncharacterized spore protein YtfJ